MNLIWSFAAQDDLLALSRYLMNENPDAARRVTDKIRHATALLITAPAMGRPGKVSGTREWVIQGYPYVVVYRLAPLQITILRVLHSAQDWPVSS